ncbi:uncharacterized protein LOC132639423 [Lycium barbarum]|uniref:uncharacterized protein LOC132639423 n=1 Tax=Lycium barbarum TaxID=112863 RepID=UPI00293EE48F|nr:uncharacterized protein LOC132639423 [Lycium barbarum]
MHNRHKFFLIGLMEPFQQSYKLESYRRRLGIDTALCNVSGKIWAFVNEDYQVTVMIDNVQQLTLKLHNVNSAEEMIVTLVNAKCDRMERVELWDSLHYLASNMTLPWLVGGDFNVICDEDEMFGDLPMTFNEVEDFRHFKANWITEVEGNAFMKFNSKLKNMRKALSQWSRATFGDIFQKISNLQEVIKVHEGLFEENPTLQNRVKLRHVEAELTRVYALVEEYWKQKAGMEWFQDGDRNSKLFHNYVNGRRKRLQLKRIQNNQGQWLDDEYDIAEEALRFFQDQFHQ